MRHLRHGEPNCLVEVTTRTDKSCRRLRPSTEIRDMILGVIGRAQSNRGVAIHAFVFMSNHYHMLVTAADASALASFLCFVNTNIAKELNRRDNLLGSVWGRRFTSIPVTGEDAAQAGRLRYILAHGVKERLVDRVRKWPGASSLPWLLDGTELRGTWRDRTAEFYARRRKNWTEDRLPEFETVYVLRMAPLPCWSHLPTSDWRRLVVDMVADIEAELAGECDVVAPPSTLGLAAVMAADPFRIPTKGPRSPAPLVHAACRSERRRWRAHVRRLRDWHADASMRFRSGETAVEFPPGMFRPGGGFASWPADEPIGLTA